MEAHPIDGTGSHLPKWLAEMTPPLHSMLTPNGAEQFKNFASQFDAVCTLISSLPPSVRIFEFLDVTTDSLKLHFSNPLSGLSHVSEALVGRWCFQQAYKFQASLVGFRFSLDQANFLLAFACARAMFEEVGQFQFFFTKLETKHKAIRDLYARAHVLSRKDNGPDAQWGKQIIEAHFALIKLMRKALEGSDYDWRGRFQNILPRSENQNAGHEQEPLRKTHTNEGIIALAAQREIDAEAIYALLSDMVHPNFGSHSLVIETRSRIDDCVGNLVLSACPRITEAATWFFELASMPLAETFSAQIDLTTKTQALLRFHQEMNTASGARPTS